MKFSPRFALRPLFVSLLIALICGVAGAQEAVKMEVGSPFARTVSPLSLQVRLKRWFPVAVTLSNSGDPLKGRLTLNLTASAGNDDGSLRVLTVYSDVELPTTARKRIWLYGRSDSETWDGATVTFTARGIKPLKSSFTIQPRDPGARLLVTISDTEERLAFLNAFTNQKLAIASELEENLAPTGAGGRQGWVFPLGGAHDLVPDRWVGLEAADLVVLHDFPHSALSPEQISAIEDYVAGGGALLVPAGQDWQRLAQSGLAAMWPVSPESSGAATAAETAELVRRYLPGGALNGADRLGGSPAVLARGALRPDAKRLAGLGPTVLLAKRDWGAGQVIWSAADPTKPPFVGWRGQESLWIELFGLTKTPNRLEYVNTDESFNGYPYRPAFMGGVTQKDATSSLVESIQSMPQLRMPSTSVIAWFLALYVFILVPVNYFVLRMMDKREWAWVTVPAIAIVFSLGSYLAARSIKGTDLLARQVNIVQGSAGSGLARSDTMLWMLTPRRADYNVSSSNAGMAMSDHYSVSPGGGMGRGGETWIREPDAGKSFRVEDFNVAMWEEAQFVGQGIVEMGNGLQIVNGSNGLSVRNGTTFGMRGVILVDGAQLYLCGKGDLRKGATEELALSPSADSTGSALLTRIAKASQLEKLFPESGKGGEDKTLYKLAGTALSAALGAKFGKDSGGSWLIGWADTPAAPLTLEEESPRLQNVTLFVMRVPDGRIAALRSAASPVRATVRTTAAEQFLGANGEVRARLYNYQCDLENMNAKLRAVEIRLYGRLIVDNYDDAETSMAGLRKAIKAGTAVRIEIFDAASGSWTEVPAQWSGRAAQAQQWTVKETLRGTALTTAIRRPDNTIQFRARTGSSLVNATSVKVLPVQ